MFEHLADGKLRIKANKLYPEHRAVCQAYRDSFGLIEYRHGFDGSYFCEYDTAGLVPLTEFFEVGKKNNIATLTHEVRMILAIGKKIGLLENSFVLKPQYVFVHESSTKPRLIYLPMDTGLNQADEYAVLLSFLEEVKKCESNKTRLCVNEAYLYLLDGEKRHEIKVTSERFILGRKKDAVSYCFVGEKYRGISRIHAAIHFDGQDYCIEDKNSSGGTFVNEKRVPPGGTLPIANGDEIKLYTTRLLFEAK